MSVIVIGKPSNKDQKGQIIFSAEVLTGFSEHDENDVSFLSKQFFLIEPPKEGHFDLYLLQKGILKNFKDYFVSHETAEITRDLSILSSCSNRVFAERLDSAFLSPNYVKTFTLENSNPRFTFGTLDNRVPHNMTVDVSIQGQQDGEALGAGKALILTQGRPCGQEEESTLEYVAHAEEKDHSLIHLKISNIGSNTSFCLIGTQYEVHHESKRTKFPKTCPEDKGFTTFAGYSPVNVYQHLSQNLGKETPYFQGSAYNLFEKIVKLYRDDRSSGNICKKNYTHHLIVIDESRMIVSDSSAAHYIPDGENIHILAPGISYNYRFKMMLQRDGSPCPISTLSPERSQHLGGTIDDYISRLKVAEEHNLTPAQVRSIEDIVLRTLDESREILANGKPS